jgi:glutaconate CoA-transferase, subunit B
MKRLSPLKKGVTDMTAFKLTELMSIRCAKEIMDGEVVFVGVGLPLVVAGYAMKTHAKNMIMCTEGGAIRATSPPGLAITVDDPCLFTGADATYGMLATMAACSVVKSTLPSSVALRSINSATSTQPVSATGPKRKASPTSPAVAAPMTWPPLANVFLAILPQDKKKFVEKVDYITTPGYLGGPGEREKLGMIGNGPSCVVSTMGVYRFDEDTKEMYLAEYFPGQTVEKIKANCAWDLKVSPQCHGNTISNRRRTEHHQGH